MPLQSAILAGNARLETAFAGGPSVKRRPPAEDPDAVRRIQRALVELGFPLPVSFATGQADGVFGDETFNGVVSYQRREFPSPTEWDGRVGPRTLARMDAQLPMPAAPDVPALPPAPVLVFSMFIRTASNCIAPVQPAGATGSAATIMPPRFGRLPDVHGANSNFANPLAPRKFGA